MTNSEVINDGKGNISQDYINAVLKYLNLHREVYEREAQKGIHQKIEYLLEKKPNKNLIPTHNPRGNASIKVHLQGLIIHRNKEGITEVCYNQDLVFRSVYKSREMIPEGRTIIETYLVGDWEELLSDVYQKVKENEKKLKEGVVIKEKRKFFSGLEEIIERFRLK